MNKAWNTNETADSNKNTGFSSNDTDIEQQNNVETSKSKGFQGVKCEIATSKTDFINEVGFLKDCFIKELLILRDHLNTSTYTPSLNLADNEDWMKEIQSVHLCINELRKDYENQIKEMQDVVDSTLKSWIKMNDDYNIIFCEVSDLQNQKEELMNAYSDLQNKYTRAAWKAKHSNSSTFNENEEDEDKLDPYEEDPNQSILKFLFPQKNFKIKNKGRSQSNKKEVRRRSSESLHSLNLLSLYEAAKDSKSKPKNTSILIKSQKRKIQQKTVSFICSNAALQSDEKIIQSIVWENLIETRTENFSLAPVAIKNIERKIAALKLLQSAATSEEKFNQYSKCIQSAQEDAIRKMIEQIENNFDMISKENIGIRVEYENMLLTMEEKLLSAKSAIQTLIKNISQTLKLKI